MWEISKYMYLNYLLSVRRDLFGERKERLVIGRGGIHSESLVFDGFLLRREEVEPLLDGDPLPRVLWEDGDSFVQELYKEKYLQRYQSLTWSSGENLAGWAEKVGAGGWFGLKGGGPKKETKRAQRRARTRWRTDPAVAANAFRIEFWTNVSLVIISHLHQGLVFIRLIKYNQI